MQSDAPVTTTLARYWPALCAVGVTALPTALVGLPLQSDGPLHHSLLTYLVVGGVVAVTIISGWSTKGMPSRALVLVSVTIGFLLNLIAFNTLVAQHDAGLEFIAPLVGLHTQTLRAILVLLLASFVSLLASFWRYVPGLGDTRSRGQGDTISDEQRHSAAPVAAGTYQATGMPQPAGAHARRNGRRAAYQPVTTDGTAGAGVPPDGRGGNTSEPTAFPNAAHLGRAGRSRVLRCALPVIAFALVCVWPAGGGSVPCHVGAEHAGFSGAIERTHQVATGKVSSTLANAPLPPPSATADRSLRSTGRTKRENRPRTEARAPP
jgi:hypothetical protein